ncbi:predicted protein [Histoplasma capsulatum G186AR]|uniref:Uncharacterized protein n=1 Tax=Ajellomyces capsulatus (strain G186AR / H82 / ATCC MYA-2454 / RMSCC 2432) TaxID=447093 RepID=C0NBI4_AJECG|nr:uncharacterized protein HCBG_00480 [Histoplasma capsulatum G186AR]EEH11025.1 predicted protein [Histoplasma capsulatum G186AR]
MHYHEASGKHGNTGFNAQIAKAGDWLRQAWLSSRNRTSGPGKVQQRNAGGKEEHHRAGLLSLWAGKIPGNGSMVLFEKFSHFCLFALDDAWTETRLVSTKG